MIDGVNTDTIVSNQADIYWDKNNDGDNEEYLPSNWVNVSVINNPPVAISDYVTTEEDTLLLIDVLANDYDPAGLDFDIHNFTTPEFGSVTLNQDGLIEYTPQLNYYGQDDFDYIIIHRDAEPEENEIASARVYITITPVNDPPVIEHIPGQSVCNGENFIEIDLDEYVSDPDNTDEEITWDIYAARTIWRNIHTGQKVTSGNLDWIDISYRIATISYPSDSSEWGKPEPAEDYESAIEGSLFVFKPQFIAMDPGGLSDFESSIGNFTVYPSFEHPDLVTETFADDENGGPASQSYDGRPWFSTSVDCVGCNYEVSAVSQFSYQTSNSFKTKIRFDGSPLTWDYTLDNLDCDLTAWEIWMYCGRTSEYSDVLLDFKNGYQESIAKISLDYDNCGQSPLTHVPRVKCWNGMSLVPLYGNLDNGWYKLRIERNETTTHYLLYNAEDNLLDMVVSSLSQPFSDLHQIQWSSSKNAIVCPMFFWDEHTVELEPLP